MELIDRPVSLPKLAFHVAWDLACLSAPPAVIGPGNYHMPESGRADLQRSTLSLLTRLDLARRGSIDPAFTNTLAVLEQPTREYYCWTHHRDDSAGAVLIAGNEHGAVRVITDHRTVLLDAISPHRLVEHLVDTLPDVPGAATDTITIAREAASAEPSMFDEDDPLAEPVTDPLAARLHQFLRVERDTTHQLYTAVRSTPTAPRRRSTPLTALDLTDLGRVLVYVQPDHNDEPTRVTLRAGSRRNLITALIATQQRL